MSLSSFVHVWQPVKDKRCSLRIFDLAMFRCLRFAALAAKQPSKNLIRDEYESVTAGSLV